MCISLGDGGASVARENAARARAEEEARQGRITQGKTGIENTFSKFDQPFYDKRRTSYLDYMMPQYDDQLSAASKDLTMALARAGLLNSSVRSRRFGDLTKKAGLEKRNITDSAIDYENKTRDAINTAKNELLNQNMSLANPTLAASQSANQAERLARVEPFSPLAQLFAGVTEGIATQAELENRQKAKYPTGLFSTGNRSKIVGD